MKIEELKGKKITVMGLGLHGGGIGTVCFLSEAGAKLIVTDLKLKEELESSLEKLKDLKNIEFVLGQHRKEDFTQVDMVIKNPAASWSNKYIKLALDNKIPVEIDSSLFFKLCRNKIIGVTGTKGKTTTSTLIYEILKIAGKKPVQVGIGQISVLDKLNELKKDSVVVFELSSWRLSALGKYKISPQVAVITNIYPDHLNYYKTMEDYIKDKKYICTSQKAQEACVLNWDVDVLREMEVETKAQVIKISRHKIFDGRAVYINDDAIYLNDGIDEKKVISLYDIHLRGGYNLENILSAIGAAFAMGVGLADIKKAVSKFSGIPHRLEFVRELDGIKYYNDTAATIPESAISGINSFSESVVLIGGGADKNLNMAEFAKVILEKTKDVIFLKGEATNKIIVAMKIAGSMQDFIIVNSMNEAVDKARELASSGDVILLSPGSASFGLFKNEFDRGDKFKELVKCL
ncbi:MAG: UDP-N-acetylmuramoyl-L-alanine--D-glutamate ligase [Candidatus Moranbacteria bacterium CG23_combo_of_CG06-09_8_20_14_all_39_10]|nr:MAG: UDP-N-acetylmuramoyl-L-alanine--D-glutamate ligase [Candidatus Moranbacteria bacterium CG23_combo_of_CG06-09_8_20_14_all_39_10]